MKLTCFFSFLIFVTSWGNSYSQLTKLNLKLTDAPVQKVLLSIEDQTDFYFIYQDEIFKKGQRVTIQSTNGSLDSILDQLADQAHISYEITNRQIILKSKDAGDFTFSQQRERTVIGIVRGQSGEPVPGVTVVMKGTNIGTITDVDGKFTLNNVPDNAIFVFSFVGMKSQEIAVGRKSQINVTMEDETIGLEEVVAIGYGTVRKKDLTGAVSSVGSTTLKEIPVTDVAQAMQGHLAGVQVIKTEGSPDAEILIRVRGGGSLTQDNSPLYIVDGFPVTSISQIAPTDIETIDVLKDASSTAIYGARGANGVILITTKGGFEGKGKISYNSYYGVKNITKTLDVLSPYEYVLWQYEGQSTNYLNMFGRFSDYDLYKQMKGTNWQDEVFGRTGTSFNNNIAFTGGTKSSKYNISLTRNDEKEVMVTSGYTRTNVMANLSQKVNNWLAVDLNSLFSEVKVDGPQVSLTGINGSSGFVTNALMYTPVEGLSTFVDPELTDPLTYEATTNYTINPVRQIKDGYRTTNTQTFNTNGAAIVTFSKCLIYRLSFGTEYTKNKQNMFYGLNTYQGRVDGLPSTKMYRNEGMTYRMSNTLTYTQRDLLPGHNLTLLAGQELYSNSYQSNYNSVRLFPQYIDPVSALSMPQLGTADPIQNVQEPDNRLLSYFGRLNYDFKGRYLVTATMRADGSSKFAPGHQWGYFPSAGLAWRVSDEKFMAFAKGWLDNLKIRGSYGSSGNNRISSNAWQKSFVVTTGLMYMGEGTPTPYLQKRNILSNKRLKWETTTTKNIGLDFTLFNGRLGGTFEGYQNDTRDLLIQAVIPGFTGYTNQWQNIGQTRNKGMEVSLNGTIIQKEDFQLAVSFNVSFNRSKIVKLGETKAWEVASNWGGSSGPLNDYLIEEGGHVGAMLGYELDGNGMYSFDDFNITQNVNGSWTYTIRPGVASDKALINTSSFGPGSLKLKDRDGDGVVNTKDRTVIGNANPKHTGGFNLTAMYKGFDFSAFINWSYGNDIYNANKLYWNTRFMGWNYRSLQSFMDSEHRFTQIDKVTGNRITDPILLAEMNKNATIWSPLMINTPLTSWAIEDGSFLRLSTVTIGYTLPTKLMRGVGITKLRIYASGYNLWCWTNYSGYDPEVSTVRSTPLTPGIDFNAYPRARTLNIGLNLEF